MFNKLMAVYEVCKGVLEKNKTYFLIIYLLDINKQCLLQCKYLQNKINLSLY